MPFSIQNLFLFPLQFLDSPCQTPVLCFDLPQGSFLTLQFNLVNSNIFQVSITESQLLIRPLSRVTDFLTEYSSFPVPFRFYNYSSTILTIPSFSRHSVTNYNLRLYKFHKKLIIYTFTRTMLSSSLQGKCLEACSLVTMATFMILSTYH